jgi:hypothetical protein
MGRLSWHWMFKGHKLQLIIHRGNSLTLPDEMLSLLQLFTARQRLTTTISLIANTRASRIKSESASARMTKRARRNADNL